MYDLYDNNIKEIFLVQGKFKVSLRLKGVNYYGIDNPSVLIRNSEGINIYNADVSFKYITVFDGDKNITNLFDNTIRKSEETVIQENPESLYKTGLDYENGENGLSKNFEKAFLYYKKAAELGHCDAQKNVGLCYQEGNGVSQSWENALEWYEKAASNGNIWACGQLGWMYRVGKECKSDRKKSFEYYMKGAKAGNAYSQMCLGDCYIYGNGVS